MTVRVPAACASLLEALVGCGFRIGELAVFMASQPFGRPELYLPSGPILYSLHAFDQDHAAPRRAQPERLELTVFL